jgi:hypothetical protein
MWQQAEEQIEGGAAAPAKVGRIYTTWEEEFRGRNRFARWQGTRALHLSAIDLREM